MPRLTIAVAAILSVVMLQAQSTLLAPTGTLRASFIATNPVQGRVDANTGVVSGPAADLMQELARRLGVKHVVMPLPDAGAVLDSVSRLMPVVCSRPARTGDPSVFSPVSGFAG